MQKMGLEPTRYCYHRHLKPARLPIPPLLRTYDILSERMTYCKKNLFEKNKKFSNKALTLPRVFDIIIKSRKDMRKCRNWQTSKTKDLVAIAVVWVQVPSSALGKMVGNLIFQRFPIFLFVAKLGYSWVTTV